MFATNSHETRRSFWRVRISVPPNHVGFLFRRNRLETRLEPGVYDFFDYQKFITSIVLPTTNRLQTVINQEVLTSDNVALRFSYVLEYRLVDADEFVKRFNLFTYAHTPFFEAEQLIHTLSQAYFRRVISTIDSEQLNEKRGELVPEVPPEVAQEMLGYGIEIVRVMIRDLTFPKAIQDLFAKHLEAKVRAKSDLENARTTVAAARALKNASELMKGDENIKFMQLLETISKIAEKGKHTFLIGDLAQNTVDLKKS